MSFFGIDMSDPEVAAKINGALGGAARGLLVPYGGIAAGLAGANQGVQSGLETYQGNQNNAMKLAGDKLDMQQKLGPLNFMRQLQGQKPLSLDDVMKGNISSPMGVPAPMSQPPIVQPQPTSAAQMAPPPATTGIPQIGSPPVSSFARPPQPTVQPQAAPAQSPAALIPDELKSNPIFQAALQAGDSNTVMKMITGADYDKTPHQGINPATQKLGDYILGPGGAVKWLDVNETPKAPTTSGGMYFDQATNSFLPIPGYTAQAQAIAAAGRAPKENWQILTDPKTQTQFRYDMDSGKALTLDGQPYTPSGAARLSGGSVPRSPQAAIMQKYMQDNPNATAEDLTKMAGRMREQISAADRFGSGPLGTQVKSFNVAIAHLDTLQDLGNALKNGDVKAINAMSNRVADEFGVAAPNNFELAKTVVGDEIAKAIIAGVGSVTDRTALQERFSRANSPDALLGVIKTAQTLMSGQVKGLKKQYENSTGLDDFNDKLFPRTQQLLGLDGPNNDGSDTPPPNKTWPSPPPGAIQMLKMKKDKSTFDAMFGPGAADKALNGK